MSKDNAARDVQENTELDDVSKASASVEVISEHKESSSNDEPRVTNSVPPVIKFGIPLFLIVCVVAVVALVTNLTGDDELVIGGAPGAGQASEGFAVESDNIPLNTSGLVTAVEVPEQIQPVDELRAEMSVLSRDIVAIKSILNDFNAKLSRLNSLEDSQAVNANALRELDVWVKKDNKWLGTLTKRVRDRVTALEASAASLQEQVSSLISVEKFDFKLKTIDRWGSFLTAVISKDGFDKDVRIGDVVSGWEVKSITAPNKVLLRHTGTGATTTLQN